MERIAAIPKGHKKIAPPPPVKALPPMSEVRICTGPCGQELPITAQYFDRDNSQTNGFRSICKMCRAEKDQRLKNQILIDKVSDLDAKTSAVLDRILEDKGPAVPHLLEVFESLTDAFGGPNGFAQHYMANFLMAKPGSSTRQKLMDTYVRMAVKCTENGSAKKPLEHMTDAELEELGSKEARRILRIAATPEVTVRDVPEQPQPPEPEQGDELKKVS